LIPTGPHGAITRENVGEPSSDGGRSDTPASWPRHALRRRHPAPSALLR
jgi:hypothetical protein